MSNRDEKTGATPTRTSTSVSSSVSGGTSGATARQSLLPSPDTSTMIIDDLAYDSGSDDEMSIEAKRVLRRKKLEREKLQKLGMLNLTLSFTHSTLSFHPLTILSSPLASFTLTIPPSTLTNFTLNHLYPHPRSIPP